MRVRSMLLVTAPLAALLVGGCGEDGPGLPGTCGLDFETRFDTSFGDAKIDSLLETTARFNVAAQEMDAEVRAACNGISTALGGASDMVTETACDNASAAIQAALDANATATLSVEFIPAVCTVDATAVADCTAMCDASFDAMATPVTCEGGMLSGTCSGMCSGTCTVEGMVACEGSCSGSCEGMCSATVEGTCTGTCSGQCDGTCSAMDGDGNCMGDCDGTCRGSCAGTVTGTCSGQCMGTCMGSCRATAMATCSGSCSGTCDVAFTAPRCEGGEVNVMADADCSASCEGSASFDASCTDPQVVITFTGTATDAAQLATLAAALRDHLPTLLSAIQKGAVMGSAALEFGRQVTGAVDAAVSTGVEAADCMRRAITVQLQAATSVQASVSVSVEVTATAGVGP